MFKKLTIFMLSFFLFGAIQAQDPPELTSWIMGTGATGQYYTSTGTIVDTGVEADVQEIWYTCDSVYIVATGVPSYLTGPFLDGNPGVPADQDWTFRIPRNPSPQTGTQTEVPLGAIGVLINGTLFENYGDAMSYNNAGVWNQSANTFEVDGFDCARGHPQGTAYHHHQNPVRFDIATNPESTICSQYPSAGLYTPDPTQHAPIIGYAFDGYPLYGSYGYANADGTGGIKRIESSYAVRNITARTHYADGTDVTDGPAINATYPLGAYKEDWEYVGTGDLDEHNGRWCVTPEYPCGTYAYFTTEDANQKAVYPYFIGPTYYGITDECNFTIGGDPGGGPGGGGPPVVPCDATPPPPPGAPCCGDGQCNGNEDADSCPDDCGGGGNTGGCGSDIAIPNNAVLFNNSCNITVDAGISPTFDGSMTVQLNGSSSATIYEWCTDDGNIVSGGTTLTPNINQEGTYVLTASNAACCESTDTIVVTATTTGTSLQVGVKIFLEGCYEPSTGMMSTYLLQEGVLPLAQPYGVAPWNHIENVSVANLASFPMNTVDWVVVELRFGTPSLSGSTPTTTLVEAHAGLLLNNGTIVDTNGDPLRFDNALFNTDYYVLVRHRNHLNVISATPINGSGTITYDFTISTTQALGNSQQKTASDGKAILYAGDFLPDAVIQVSDFDAWKSTPAILFTYSLLDGNMDAVVQTTDYDLWLINKAKIGIAEVGF